MTNRQQAVRLGILVISILLLTEGCETWHVSVGPAHIAGVTLCVSEPAKKLMNSRRKPGKLLSLQCQVSHAICWRFEKSHVQSSRSL